MLRLPICSLPALATGFATTIASPACANTQPRQWLEQSYRTAPVRPAHIAGKTPRSMPIHRQPAQAFFYLIYQHNNHPAICIDHPAHSWSAQ